MSGVCGFLIACLLRASRRRAAPQYTITHKKRSTDTSNIAEGCALLPPALLRQVQQYAEWAIANQTARRAHTLLVRRHLVASTCGADPALDEAFWRRVRPSPAVADEVLLVRQQLLGEVRRAGAGSVYVAVWQGKWGWQAPAAARAALCAVQRSPSYPGANYSAVYRASGCILSCCVCSFP